MGNCPLRSTRTPPTLLVFVGMAFLAACGPSLTVPEGRRTPALQALLLAGTDTQVIWVEWAVPPESAYGRNTRPVDTALVQLVLQSGALAALFKPKSGIAARLDAPMTVHVGSSYRLMGNVAGFPVDVVTSPPSQVRIVEPATDTVRPGAGIDSVIVRWSGTGFDGFLTRVQPTSPPAPGTTRLIGSIYAKDTSIIVRRNFSRDTLTVFVVGLDPSASLFFDNTKRVTSLNASFGNVAGVAGVFGSATVDRRVIIWP